MMNRECKRLLSNLLVFLLLWGNTYFAQNKLSVIASYNIATENLTSPERPFVDVDGAGVAVRSIHLADDLDGDGKMEIIATDYSYGGRVHVFEYDYNDVLQLVWSSPTDVNRENLRTPRWVQTGDLDGDGNMEIIFSVGPTYTGNLMVYENIGDNDFGTSPMIDFPAEMFVSSGLGPFRMDMERGTVADFDGDGQDELILTNQDNNIYILSISGNAPGFAAWVVEAGDPILDATSAVTNGSAWHSVSADIDGDGVNEIVNSNWNNLGFSSIEVTGANSYTFPTPNGDGGALGPSFYEYYRAELIDGVPYMGLAVADVDGDGKDEVAAVPYPTYDLALIAHPHGANGTDIWDDSKFSVLKKRWDLSATGDDNAQFWGCYAADLNGNGRDEILVGGFYGDNIVAIEYIGTGDILDGSNYNVMHYYGGKVERNWWWNTITIRDSLGILDTLYSKNPWDNPGVVKMSAGDIIGNDGNLELVVCYQVDEGDSVEVVNETWNGLAWEITSTRSNFNLNQNVIQVLSYDESTNSRLEVTTPNGEENWEAGTNQTIRWTSNNVTNVEIEYTTNNGNSWSIITSSTLSDGNYSWTIPNTPSTNCKVKISEVGGIALDISNEVFTISEVQNPTIEVTSPNGGEVWEVGTPQTIGWTSTDVANVKLEYSINGGSYWTTITSSTPSDGNYSWTIPNSSSINCRVRVSEVGGGASDVSNANFTISNPTIEVTYPNGGEDWVVGSNLTINWTSTDVTSVKIEYTTNNGNSWSTIISSTLSDGNYSWTIPNTPSTNCKVKISEVGGSALDISNGTFTISEVKNPIIEVTSPNGGENWEISIPQTIRWESTDVTNVKIEYSIDNGTTWSTIASSTPSDGIYGWIVPSTPSANCKVKISEVGGIALDISNEVFTISEVQNPTIEVTSPNGGENLEIGLSHYITWISQAVDSVKIEYTKNNGSSWTSIISSTPSDGSYEWVIPNDPTTNCKIKISDVGGSTSDISNASFIISPSENPVLSISSPNGGEKLVIGTNYNIKWVSQDVDNVKIEYSTDGGSNWETIVDTTLSDESYDWIVANTPSIICKVKISDTSNPSIFSISDGVFTISKAIPNVVQAKPENGSGELLIPIKLIWYNPPEADSYGLQVSTDENFNTIIIDETLLTDTSFVLTELNDFTTYYWHVNGSNLGGAGNWSDVWSFTTLGIPVVVNPLSPENNVEDLENPVEFNWSSAQYADDYLFELSLSESFSSLELDSVITDTSLVLNNLISSNKFYWRVKARNVAGENTSNTFAFTMMGEKIITIASPNGGEIWTSGTSQNITWTSENIDSVKVEYSTNSGTDWITIENSISVIASPYTWIVPEVESENCLVKISDVSHSSVSDLSDAKFTITMPPLVLLTYPNGNEMFDVSEEATITWNSRNLDKVNLEYSQNGGADWTTIVTDIAANNSYTWTIPNTPSVDCFVKITSSDDSNLNDKSDETFVIYPPTVVVEREVSFGNVDADESFRMIGLPGNGEVSLSDLFNGNSGYDWKAYYDNGNEGTKSDYLEEYDGTSKFNFRPGLGFWIVAAENLKINETFESVPVKDGYATIPLNSGWNVISNPFELAVEWKEVALLNGLENASDVIYKYDGTYSISTNFEPYIGYYYLNDAAGVTSLKIPYHSNVGGGLAKKAEVINNDIVLTLKEDKQTWSTIKLGFREDALNGFDKYDIYFPRYIGSEGMVINNTLLNNFLMEDYRKEIGEGIEYNLQLNLKPNKKYRLNLSGFENYQDYDVILIDTRLSKVYCFDENIVTVKSMHKENNFKLLFGTSQFIEDEIKNLIPKEYLLYQNYPNPFNPNTVIRFSLPKESRVELKIYSILGEEVTTLISNKTMNAGNHEVDFRTANLASGVYFYKIIATDFTDVKKMVLLK